MQDPWGTILAVSGELVVAIVIYLEIENQRLDRFIETAFTGDFYESRRRLFGTATGLTATMDAQWPSVRKIKSLRKGFQEAMAANPDLRHQFTRQIGLFDRIGGALPALPLQRARARRWFPHTAVFLWMFLADLIHERQEQTFRAGLVTASTSRMSAIAS
jgi:hypothetical protein